MKAYLHNAELKVNMTAIPLFMHYVYDAGEYKKKHFINTSMTTYTLMYTPTNTENNSHCRSKGSGQTDQSVVVFLILVCY